MSEDWYVAEQPVSQRRAPGELCLKICSVLFAVWSLLMMAQAVGLFTMMSKELLTLAFAGGCGIGGLLSCVLGLIAARTRSPRMLVAFNILLALESVVLLAAVGWRAYVLSRLSRTGADFGQAVVIFGEQSVLDLVYVFLASLAIFGGSWRLLRSLHSFEYEPMVSL